MPVGINPNAFTIFSVMTDAVAPVSQIAFT